MTSELLVVIAITFVAAIVNGALGYGFSSITVPVALLVVSNRLLNAALVPLEVVLNGYVLWVNRHAFAAISRRVLPIVLGLGPGVAVGTIVLVHLDPSWLRLGTFALLLPLILLQAAGWRRPIRSERVVGAGFGVGVGVLYSVTTVSGPPLAIFLNNQGFAKEEFRAALGVIRITEATLTTLAYANAKLFTPASASLLISILPSVALGIPIGAWLIRRVRAETFRRVCMSFDAAVVAFGLSTLLRALHIVESPLAYLLLGGVVVFDAALLYRFFRVQRRSLCGAHGDVAAPAQAGVT